MVARRNLTLFAAAVIALCAIAAPASAQITTGTVSGTVKDPQGAVIPGAAVTLISETRGTRASDVFTNANGDFVFVNVSPDRYTVQVTMSGFKTLERSRITVTAGDRLSVGALTIEVGGLTETVQVTAFSPTIQAESGERSFTIDTESVQNLPIGNRSFTELAALAPGVITDGNNTPQRIGGGGDPNIMMDGVSTMDTGSNRPLLQMNVESIAQVKVLTSGYQAEYGRASGVHVTAVTKSGTNRFRGSVYDVERSSDWNANSKTNNLNGDPKPVVREKDWGFSMGGPLGKAGGKNKLFFFYSQEFSPRTKGNDVVRYRMPTALERGGDFSQTTDNNGRPYPYIKDPLSPFACSASNMAGCFQDGGVIGRIPADRIYQPGLNILKMFPLPNIANVPANQNYNFELTRPNETILSWQPAVRLDYQPMQKLRATFKYSAWQQKSHLFNGTIPGFNDTRMQNAPVVSYTVSVNYSLNSTTFLEATYGHSQNELAGCAQAQSGTGAIFCNNNAGSQGIAMGPLASLSGAGLQNLPFLFPNATVLDPGYYAVTALNELQPAFWDGARMTKVPTFSWGNRVANAPPNLGFPGWFNINATQDFSVSVTKVRRRHTFKSGFYNTHSFKAEQVNNNAFGVLNFQQDAVGTNQFDTSFGFANAALGSFSSYLQALKYVETASVYNNTEGYIQDNWKASNRLTLDYGVRFTHQQAQYDKLGQASNFLPDRWTLSAAPVMYVAGCVSNAYPCTGANRQAMNPLTGQLLGPNSTTAIGTLVPNSGSATNGLFLPGGDIPRATYKWPFLSFGPRFGMAYDVSGRQRFVLRGGAGLFFNRPSTTTISGGVNNPPTSAQVTVQFGQLQTLGSGGLTIQGAPALAAIKLDSKLPSSTQWNAGMQMALPWAVTLDLSYVGQHSFNTFQGVNLNAVDFGTAFLPQFQDATLAPSTTPGATAVQTNLMRPMRGYGGITQQWDLGWRTYHSIQMSFQRRFKDGVSFGFNDTMSLSDRQQAPNPTGASGTRLQHNADGSYSIRSDQAEANRLLGNNNPVPHVMRANFVWDLPDIHSGNSALQAIGLVVNDWQVSGIWSGVRAVGFGSSTRAYTVGFNYQNGGGNVNLTGSPDYAPRIRVVGDPGRGCSSDPYRQFNTAAFQGPLPGSVGLESGNSYLEGCFISVLDLAIARNIRLGRARTVQVRVDMFNAPNAAAITGRNTTINLSNPNDPVTATNLPFDASGNLIVSRSLPRGAGFGVANAYQPARNMQIQVRFSF
jgi:Carboxypeptidase regulatory-like domain/TonB-dependent Receptor Plug Domain